MRTHPRNVLLVGAAALVLAVATTACESSRPRPTMTGPTTTKVAPPTTAITKASFLTRADGICEQTQKEVYALDDIESPGGGKPTDIAYSEALTAMITARKSNLENIQALPQPPGDESVLAQWYAESAEWLRIAEEGVAVFEAGDDVAGEVLVDQMVAARQRAAETGFAYGFIQCG